MFMRRLLFMILFLSKNL